MVSIRELAVTGRSGVVGAGRPKADVIRSLGEPTDRSLIRPLILRYGRLELTFHDDGLILTAYYPSRGVSDGRIAEDMPTAQEEVELLLRERGLRFHEDADLTYDDQIAINVENAAGTLLLFEDGELTSVQVSRNESEARQAAAG
jgi:hypothetical protein